MYIINNSYTNPEKKTFTLLCKGENRGTESSNSLPKVFQLMSMQASI